MIFHSPFSCAVYRKGQRTCNPQPCKQRPCINLYISCLSGSQKSRQCHHNCQPEPSASYDPEKNHSNSKCQYKAGCLHIPSHSCLTDQDKLWQYDTGTFSHSLNQCIIKDRQPINQRRNSCQNCSSKEKGTLKCPFFQGKKLQNQNSNPCPHPIKNSRTACINPLL